jgi:hypothetical protein
MKHIIIAFTLILLQGCKDSSEISDSSVSGRSSGKTADNVTPTQITIKARGVDVFVVAESKITGTIAPQTLASRSFSYIEETDNDLSWWIEESELFLRTNISSGPLMSIPDDFVTQEKKLSDRRYQLGAFFINGSEMLLILEIKNRE